MQLYIFGVYHIDAFIFDEIARNYFLLKFLTKFSLLFYYSPPQKNRNYLLLKLRCKRSTLRRSIHINKEIRKREKCYGAQGWGKVDFNFSGITLRQNV